MKDLDCEDWQSVIHKVLDKARPSAIFHVGAISNTLHTDVASILKYNWEVTTILSDYCAKVNIPLIYSSTAAIYGDNNGDRNLYAWSKFAGEKHVIANQQIALRYFNVYGPGEEDKGRMASIIYQSLVKYQNDEEMKLFPGNPKRDFVHVEDVVNANIYALTNYFKLDRKFYEVGVGEVSTFEYIMNTVGIPFSYYDESEIPGNYQFFTKSDKGKWMKGWQPKYNLKEGIEEYKEYFYEKLLSESGWTVIV
jgi:ADP-L-glycero-D-manno-heptose 6-epimerase